MKNLTLTAEPDQIERARARALNEKRSLNDAFREWLERYSAKSHGSEQYHQLMEQISASVQTTRSFSRDEMNER